jgi:hypothetical protein
MPLISLEDMRKDAMSQTRIQVTAAFIYECKSVEVGDIITVSKGFAREMIHANKAILAPAETAPVTSQQPPALATQTVSVETPEPPQSPRRTRS